MWPLERECDAFYGNPRGRGDQVNPAWVGGNLVGIRAPFRVTYDGRPVSSIQIHRLCADSLRGVLKAIWAQAMQDQATVDAWGASIFGGSFNFRLKRGLNTLSMHSYGAAIDLDPARNALGSRNGHFTANSPVVMAFESAGWEWGGRWKKRPDPMHFRLLGRVNPTSVRAA